MTDPAPLDVDPASVIDLGAGLRRVDGSESVTLLIPNVPDHRAVEIARVCAQAILNAEGWSETDAATMVQRVVAHITEGLRESRIDSAQGDLDDGIPF